MPQSMLINGALVETSERDDVVNPATGKKILQAAASDLKRVTLELGGNDPAIVLDDVDPAAVLDGLFWGAFTNSGQVCTAIKRLYVHEAVYAAIVDGLVERANSVKVGDGLDPDTQLGPINNKMQFDKVVDVVEDARRPRRRRRDAAGARRARRAGTRVGHRRGEPADGHSLQRALRRLQVKRPRHGERPLGL